MAYISDKEIAVQIRKDLKQVGNFKFSVRMNSIGLRLDWIDGPTTEEMRQVILKYASTSITLDRKYSEDFYQQAVNYSAKKYGWNPSETPVKVREYSGASVEHESTPEGIEKGRLIHSEISKRSGFEKFPDPREEWQQKERERLEQLRLEEEILANAICPLPTEIIGTEFIYEGKLLKVIETKPVLNKSFNPPIIHWYYQTQNPTDGQSSWGAKDLDLAINPIVAKVSKVPPFDVMGKFSIFSKNNTLKECEEVCSQPEFNSEKSRNWSIDKCRVEYFAELSDSDYDRFCENLSAYYSWLENKGGDRSDYTGKSGIKYRYDDLSDKERVLWAQQSYRECVLLCAPNRPDFLIDPQGYSYARYAGFLVPYSTDTL
ncbi:MAG: LPD29 domain-containing protein [Crinalium sp.]